MTARQRQLHLGAVPYGTGGPGSHTLWLDPEIPGDASVDVDWFVQTAQLADCGKFDLVMNPSRATNPDLQSQLAKVRATPTDDPTYPALLQEATKIAVTSYPNTFLYNAPSIIARQKSVTELPQHPSLRRFEGISA